MCRARLILRYISMCNFFEEGKQEGSLLESTLMRAPLASWIFWMLLPPAPMSSRLTPTSYFIVALQRLSPAGSLINVPPPVASHKFTLVTPRNTFPHNKLNPESWKCMGSNASYNVSCFGLVAEPRKAEQNWLSSFFFHKTFILSDKTTITTLKCLLTSLTNLNWLGNFCSGKKKTAQSWNFFL